MIAKNKSSNWNFTGYELSQALVVGQTYTFSADVNFTEGVSDKVSVLSYKNNNLTEPDSNIQTVSVVNGKITGSFIATVPNDGRLLFYAGESGRTYGKVAEVKNAKLERGTIATDWTPAPEDLQADIDGKATTASLNEFKQTQATKDNATAQKLSQLESTVQGVNGRVGTSESKIASLERTASDTNQALATAQNQLNARFDNLVVGGRNLLLKSDVLVDDNKYGHDYELSEAPEVGEEVTATVWGNLGDGRSVFAVYNTFGYGELAKLKKVADGVHRATFKWKKSTKPESYKNPDDTHLAIYAYPQSATSNNIIRKIKLERGSVGTDWTPAPEDNNVDLSPYATNASLNEFKQTQATQNTATAQKVATLQTTLNGQTTSIRNVEQSVNGVRAIKAVTVDNNGVISGYGLISELQNGRITSRFGINADQFYIGNPNNNKKLFNVYTSPQIVNGVTVPAGTYLDSAFIAKGSINMLHISDSIQSDNYVVNKSGWKLHKNGNFEINSSFGDGTRLQITSKGLVGWYDNHKKAFELGIFT